MLAQMPMWSSYLNSWSRKDREILYRNTFLNIFMVFMLTSIFLMEEANMFLWQITKLCAKLFHIMF